MKDSHENEAKSLPERVVSHHRHREQHIPKMLHFLQRGSLGGGRHRFHFLFQYFLCRLFFRSIPPPDPPPWDKGSKSTLAKVHPLSSQNQMELKTTLPLPIHTPLVFSYVFSLLALYPRRSQLVRFVNGRNQLL